MFEIDLINYLVVIDDVYSILYDDVHWIFLIDKKLKSIYFIPDSSDKNIKII